MKKIYLIAILVLMTISASAQSPKSIYNKYRNEKEVTTIYISPTMFKLIGAIPELDLADEDVNITPIVKSLDAMYIIECEDFKTSQSLVNDVKSLISKKKYELIMETKEGDDIVEMYIISDGQVVNSFIILCAESDEVVYMMFEGHIAMSDFQAMFLNR